MRYSGVFWTLVGLAGFSAGRADSTCLVFQPSTNAPHVAYVDYGNGNRATVMAYDGSAWSAVGSAGFTSNAVYGTSMSLAFSPSTSQPYVAFSDSGNSNKATVMAYDGSCWAAVGSPGFSADTAVQVVIAFNPSTNAPYVAYQDLNCGSNQVTVMAYAASAWSTVGSACFTADQADWISLAFQPGTALPYIAYQDASVSGHASVMRYDSGSSNWVMVGSPGFASPSGATSESLAFQPISSQPFLAFQESTVTTWNGSGPAWDGVGPAHFWTDQTHYTSLAFKPNAPEPYVAFQDWANNLKATVVTYPLPPVSSPPSPPAPPPSSPPSPSPPPPSPPPPFVTDVQCWGEASSGATGTQSFVSPILQPTRVVGAYNFIQLSAGQSQ